MKYILPPMPPRQKRNLGHYHQPTLEPITTWRPPLQASSRKLPYHLHQRKCMAHDHFATQLTHEQRYHPHIERL